MTAQKRIGVVIPCLLAFKQCLECLASVETKQVWTPLIAPQWIENKPIAQVWNEYSEMAFNNGCDYVLILNDDVVLFPQTVDNLFYELSSSVGLHLVSGVSVDSRDAEVAASSLVKENLNFSCFMITPQLFKQAGYFDENFSPAYFEDNDMHYRMQLLGLPAHGISNAPFTHHHSFTSRAVRQSAQADEAHAAFRACKAYYKSKWGGEPGEEKWKHPYNDEGLSPRRWKWIARNS